MGKKKLPDEVLAAAVSARPTKPSYEYMLRATNPEAEMHCVVMIDGDIEWYADMLTGVEVAQKALDDAKEGGYTVSVYVLRSVKQNGEG